MKLQTEISDLVQRMAQRVCVASSHAHLEDGKRKELAMERNGRLCWFITFILLSAPQKRAVAASDFTHIQPVIPELLPITRYLKAVLDRARARELSARKPLEAKLVFRIGQPE